LKNNRARPHSGARELLVYCASGIRLPVEEAARQFEEDVGVTVRVEYDSSGGLEGKLKLDKENSQPRADVYIPADVSFAERAQAQGLIAEVIPLAQFHLVLGVNPGFDKSVSGLNDLMEQEIAYAMCEPIAGVGKCLKDVVEPLGLYERLYEGKKAGFTRVTETANSVATTKELEAAFVWNTTAHQFGLEARELPELAKAYSTIVGGVVSDCRTPADALRFIRYLAAPEKGRPLFAKHHFDLLEEEGDSWAHTPELVVYCGGVNQHAVKTTMSEFEAREGCDIIEQFAGCGKLVAGMKAIDAGGKGYPDTFMTCDASYLTKVEEEFGVPADVSSTRIMMLVRKGNPKGLKSIKDLAQPGLAIGVTDAKVSTLGHLSRQLFAVYGVANAIEENKTIAVTTPTAHELILQVVGHGKLDVALVYEANCTEIKGEYDLVPIEHPLARTVQNIAVSRKSPYPAMSRRLMDAILSAKSRERFEASGFSWKGAP
jgi:molybdate transport system substrate-binding protein